jgi:hypothetical protein
MKKEQILSIVRHSMTFIGGLLITKGYIDDAQLAEISGAIVSLISIVWSILDKK